jgi:uncharacterized membrane protein (UPF0127 family)
MKIRIHIALILLQLGLLLTSCKKEIKTIEQTKVTFTKEGTLTIHSQIDTTKVTLDIEIAKTNFEIQTGLMYRDSMENNQGMLFVFENETPRFFYMKNTKIPLDLIFINANNKIVSFQKEAKPFNESSLPSNAPAKFVLEINAGLVTNLNLSVGDSISFTKQ